MPSSRRGEISGFAGAPPRSPACLTVAPPVVVSVVGRAKHQKLKTGSDQSPGDKKTEAESEQGKFVNLSF